MPQQIRKRGFRRRKSNVNTGPFNQINIIRAVNQGDGTVCTEFLSQKTTHNIVFIIIADRDKKIRVGNTFIDEQAFVRHISVQYENGAGKILR